jgi:hypothetical protein
MDTAIPTLKTAVFKPIEGQNRLFHTIPPATGSDRQVAAFLLDSKYGGVAGVALSVYAETKKHGLGSLQVFKDNHGALTDLSAEEKNQLPAQQLHLLTIHRARLFELDGNPGNVLWRINAQGGTELISIDHDYILPVLKTPHDLGISRLSLSWALFPQMEEPFDTVSKDYIRSLNPAEDAHLLQQLEFDPEACDLLQAATWSFQMGAEADLTPGDLLDYLSSRQFGQKFIEIRAAVKQCIKSPDTFNAAFETAMKEELAIQVAYLKETVPQRKALLQECLHLIAQGKSHEASIKAEAFVKRYVPQDIRKAIIVLDTLMKQGDKAITARYKAAISSQINDFYALQHIHKS